MLNIQAEKQKVEKMSGATGTVTHSSDMASDSMPQDILYSGYIKRFMSNGRPVDISSYATIGDDMLKLYWGTWQTPLTINVDSKLNATGPQAYTKSVFPDVGAKTENPAQETQPTQTESTAPASKKNYLFPIGGIIIGAASGALIFHEHRLLGALGAAIILGGAGYFLMNKF